MILCPENRPQPDITGWVSAWDAVSRAQRTHARKYRLVRQPDHARLSGELAQHFSFEGMPTIRDEIVQGISLHDEGWKQFDGGDERLAATPSQYSPDGIPMNDEGKPLSFEEIKAGDFLKAWRGSIESAEAIAPIAGLIVSGHFCRLGRFGVQSGRHSQFDAELVRDFLRLEAMRRERLSERSKYSVTEIEYWTDVLQFCDLLSLYLCCGSRRNVEFPQHLTKGGETIRLRVEDGGYVSSPALLPDEIKFGSPAVEFPKSRAVQLSWVLR